MIKRKEDRRSKYSQRVIKETFLSLLNENGFDSVTITEICEKADINRGTFYHYYVDIYDLADHILNETVSEIDGLLTRYEPYDKDMDKCLAELVDMIDRQRPVSPIHSDPTMSEKFNKKMAEVLDPHLRVFIATNFADLPENKQVVYTSFLIGGITDVTNKWLLNRHNLNKEEVTESLTEIVLKNIH